MKGQRLRLARSAHGYVDRLARVGIPPQFVELSVGGQVFAVEGDDLVADAEPSSLSGTTRDDIEDRDEGGGRCVEIVFMVEADFNGIRRTANGVHPGESKQGGRCTEKGCDAKEKRTWERSPRAQGKFGRGVGHSQYRVRFDGTRVND